jgi:hypothetical protein
VRRHHRLQVLGRLRPTSTRSWCPRARPPRPIRLNGEAVGRTPTTIKVDRTKNYELQVGKGGYLTEASELKPRLITTSEGIEFGFPAAVKVNLTKAPAAKAKRACLPPTIRSSRSSRRRRSAKMPPPRKACRPTSPRRRKRPCKIQAALAAREAAAQARLAEIAKSIAAAKASKGKDPAAAKAKLAEAELALAQATADAASRPRLRPRRT